MYHFVALKKISLRGTKGYYSYTTVVSNTFIRDLLGVNTKQKLDLKENPDRGVYVKSLSHHQGKLEYAAQIILLLYFSK